MDIVIRLLTIDEVEKNESYLLSYLDNERIINAKKMVDKSDYLRSLGAGYLIKKYTTSSPLKYNEYHKPLKDDCYFNVSHSYKYIAFVSYEKECGVDIEEIRPFNHSLIDYAFSKDIASNITSSLDFFRYWTLKEALGKAQGKGLVNHFKTIPSIIGKVLYEGNTYYNYSIHYDDYVIAVSVKDNESKKTSIVFETIEENN
jgi:phosphopantetheinyl transferase